MRACPLFGLSVDFHLHGSPEKSMKALKKIAHYLARFWGRRTRSRPGRGLHRTHGHGSGPKMALGALASRRERISQPGRVPHSPSSREHQKDVK